MIRWYPMARAVSRLAGRPIVYDLTQIRYLTRVFPSYQPIVRRIETITRNLREKKFAVRGSAEVGFQVPHSRTINSLSRWYEVDGQNLLLSPTDFSLAPWTVSNAAVAVSPAKDPVGTFTAHRVTDSTGAAIGLLQQNTGIPAATFTGLLQLQVRADAPHIVSLGLQDSGGSFAVDQDTNVEAGWRRIALRQTFPNNALNFQVMIRPTQLTASLQGDLDLWLPDLRKIEALPGTDEEVLADLKDKLSSDDWDVYLSLDGLSFRRVLLDEHEKVPMEDKWVGYSERFAFTVADAMTRVPATLDGTW